MSVDARLGAPVRIEVGKLTATFAEGDLFDVRWGGVEVAQRLYLAVRDEAWNTIPARIWNVVVAQTAEVARVEFDALHEDELIRYQWRGTIAATAEGELSYEMRGRALQEFRYCKIGFNVHHGLRSHAGRTFRFRGAGGECTGSFGPDLVPQLVRGGTLTAMTPHFDRLQMDLDGVDVSYSFEGDRFELQDHRNWLDANWKTYGTPLEYGFPMDISDGGELYQRIALSVSGSRYEPHSGIVELSWDESPPAPLPRIGHLLTVVPDDAQVTRLRALRPDHIRVDLHPGADLSARLAEAEAVAASLAAGLEVGAFLRPEHAAEDAGAFADAVAHCSIRIDRILVLAEVTGFSAFRGACPPEVSDHVRAALAAKEVQGFRIVSGTSQFFVDINRDRPDYSRIDGVVFAVNPQVHASDDRSVMQNPGAIPDVVAFARRLYGEIDVVMSPVDLIGVNGPYPAGPSRQDESPANCDPRQRTTFCAAWTLAVLAQLVRSRTTSSTLFDLIGPRGLLIDPEQEFPVARLLAHVARLRSFPVISIRSGDPDRVAALAFDDGGDRVFVIANLAQAPTTVRLPSATELTVPGYGVVLSSSHGTETVA